MYAAIWTAAYVKFPYFCETLRLNMSNWFLLVFFFISLSSIAIGFFRHRRFRVRNALHYGLAKDLGMKIAYAREDDFRIFGEYNGYKLTIEAAVLSNPPSKKGQQVVRFRIPMVNPMRKGWRVAKPSADFPAFDKLGIPDRPVRIGQVLPGLELSSNDLLFNGLILSDDLKINLHTLFKKIPAGVVFIQDEQLAFYFPGLLVAPEYRDLGIDIANILCEIKDELKFGSNP